MEESDDLVSGKTEEETDFKSKISQNIRVGMDNKEVEKLAMKKKKMTACHNH